MLQVLSQRLLTVFQLTRMALVFTAISNSLCTLLLLARREHPHTGNILGVLDWRQMLLASLVSIGLYGFGMSLNDIIDRLRDRQMAAHRPLPSGRIGVITAHLICVALGLMALAAGMAYAELSPAGWTSVALIVWTGLLIAFYDFAGKYLVAMGILTLGVIRLSHAIIPAGGFPLVWHPLLLFTHVAVLSAVAYDWEEKRPTLTRAHWMGVLAGVVAVDLTVAWAVRWWNGHAGPGSEMPVWPVFTAPMLSVALFLLIAWNIRRRSATRRQAGGTLMLVGLLWLIVYDAAFVGAYVGWIYGVVHLLLAPLSYLLVLSMRWWSQLVLLSQQPQYKRARGAP